LAAAWGRTEVWVLAHDDDVVPAEVEVRFRSWIERRAAGEPAEHLTGRCSFWGREFRVSPDVLIPRPETELLVDRALALPLPPGCRAVDIGTGSGCIALTLALERPRWRVAAVDRQPRAVAVAKRNADRLGGSLGFVASDLGMALGPGWDLVVANLPYIPETELVGLPLEVHRDPRTALDGGSDGLDLVRRLVADLGRLLRPSGRALLELYEGQALHEEIERYLTEAGFILDGRYNTHLHQGEPIQADLLFRRAPPAAGVAPP
jgi:release factor glutamine methyltransferase